MPDHPGVYPPELLTKRHSVDEFDYGTAELNDFLKWFALANQSGGTSRTYVIHRSDRVVGYYSLAPASVAPADAPERVMKGQSRLAVPVILLARLAIDVTEQGHGFGKHLLLDAFRRAAAGAEVIGGRALLVHAKDENARAFYQRFDMQPSPTDPLHLYLLMKDLRAALQG